MTSSSAALVARKPTFSEILNPRKRIGGTKPLARFGVVSPPEFSKKADMPSWPQLFKKPVVSSLTLRPAKPKSFLLKCMPLFTRPAPYDPPLSSSSMALHALHADS